jgi:hypothetical protein
MKQCFPRVATVLLSSAKQLFVGHVNLNLPLMRDYPADATNAIIH